MYISYLWGRILLPDAVRARRGFPIAFFTYFIIPCVPHSCGETVVDWKGLGKVGWWYFENVSTVPCLSRKTSRYSFKTRASFSQALQSSNDKFHRRLEGTIFWWFQDQSFNSELSFGRKQLYEDKRSLDDKTIVRNKQRNLTVEQNESLPDNRGWLLAPLRTVHCFLAGRYTEDVCSYACFWEWKGDPV